MKNYFKSLLPYRWIILLVFIVLSQLLFLNFNALGFPTEDTIVLSIISPFFWIAIDLLFGLGRKSPLSDKPLTLFIFTVLLYGTLIYAIITHYDIKTGLGLPWE